MCCFWYTLGGKLTKMSSIQALIFLGQDSVTLPMWEFLVINYAMTTNRIGSMCSWMRTITSLATYVTAILIWSVTNTCWYIQISHISHWKKGVIFLNLALSMQIPISHIVHYSDVIMGAMPSQIIWITIVYSTVCSSPDQRKFQSSASLAFVCGIHRSSVNSPHKWPVTRKMFPFDDVIMLMHANSLQQQIWVKCFYISHLLRKIVVDAALV